MNSQSVQVQVQVSEEYHIAVARRTVRHMAEAIGFSSRDVCYIETSVSELASNLFFHTTKGGTLFFVPICRVGISCPPYCGIEIISQDPGPGIPDLELAMQDGFSTYGGLGGGLPGVQRLMDEFEITSQETGTRIITRKWKKILK